LTARLCVVAALTALILAGCGSGSSVRRPLPSAVWGEPLNGQPARAVVMLIHGGGWSGLSPAGLRLEVGISPIFRKLGYATFSVDYRRGAQGLADLESFYEQARRRVGPRVPICAYGVSAGGHLALMLAVNHPDLACVIDLAGPTDLAALRTERGGGRAYQIARAVFGPKLLNAMSPALHASSIRSKLLLVYADNDPLVPAAQGLQMARAAPASRLILLPPGTASFVHTGVYAPVATTGVSVRAKAAAAETEVQFLAGATGG
jgi:acetyl esterase/lipase